MEDAAAVNEDVAGYNSMATAEIRRQSWLSSCCPSSFISICSRLAARRRPVLMHSRPLMNASARCCLRGEDADARPVLWHRRVCGFSKAAHTTVPEDGSGPKCMRLQACGGTAEAKTTDHGLEVIENGKKR